MKQEGIDELNAIAEIHLSLTEIYHQLSEESSVAKTSHAINKKQIFEKLSKEIIQLIYNLGGKYTEIKNPTENKLMNLNSTVLDGVNKMAYATVNDEISKCIEALKKRYKNLLKEQSFSEEHQNILKNHLNEL